ncbi:MAG: hypothetical protein K2Z81_07930, partial [Cyanobacteria bacterium]|nr:hypothetical protein [Cyanobacteriota bacterium]
IYSLGCVLFEALTGQPPFSGQTNLEIASKHCSTPPPGLKDVRADQNYSEAIEQVVSTCLQKSKEQRYQSALELKNALLKAVDNESYSSLSEHEDGGAESGAAELQLPPSERSSRNRVVVAAGIASILAGIACLAFRLSKPADELIVSGPSSPTKTAERAQSDIVYAPLPLAALEETGNSRLTESSPGVWDYTGLGLVKDDDLKNLVGRHVETLIIKSGHHIDGAGLQYLKGLPLKELVIRNSIIRDSSISAFARMSELVSLDLTSSCRLTGVTLDALKVLPKLKTVTLKQSPLTDRGVEKLCEIPGLERVEIGYCPLVTKRALSALDRLKRLKYLSISGMKLKANDLPSTVLNRLFSLDIEQCEVDDDMLRAIPKSPICVLNIARTKIDDKQLKLLSAGNNLVVLDISYCPRLSSESLDFLIMESKVRSLKLLGWKLSPQDFDLLSHRELLSLEIDSPGLDVKCIRKLLSSRHILALRLSGMTMGTDEIRQLQEEFPTTTISFRDRTKFDKFP